MTEPASPETPSLPPITLSAPVVIPAVAEQSLDRARVNRVEINTPPSTTDWAVRFFWQLGNAKGVSGPVRNSIVRDLLTVAATRNAAGKPKLLTACNAVQEALQELIVEEVEASQP